MKYKALLGVTGLMLALGLSSQALAYHKVMGQIKTNLRKPIYFTTTGPITVSHWNGKMRTFWMQCLRKTGKTSGSLYFYLKRPNGKRVPLCVYSFTKKFYMGYNGRLNHLTFSKTMKAKSKHRHVKCQFGLSKTKHGRKIIFYIMGYHH